VCEELDRYASHIFTTRTLELRHDPAEWRAVASVFDPLQLIRQVHGKSVCVVRRDGNVREDRPEADIIVSESPSVAIGVRVADCAPILVADTRRGAVAAAHAGWRGTAQGVASTTVGAMVSELGSSPRDLVAAIGPCLGGCCGEVGEDVVQAFRAGGHPAADLDRWFARGAPGKWLFDLPAANRDQLVAAGIPTGQVHVAGLCTRTHAEFFHSYRAHGASAGRMLAAIRPSAAG
jgi:YfiH family protein